MTNYLVTAYHGSLSCSLSLPLCLCTMYVIWNKCTMRDICGCVLHSHPARSPHASVVATVVRRPRSEVSQRHRAGSWVWVVSKSRLDNFVELELPPHEVGVLPRVA